MEIEVGLGTITEVRPKFAFLKMATGNLEAEGNYIVRKTEKKAPAAAAKKRASSPTPQRRPQEPSRKDAFLNK